MGHTGRTVLFGLCCLLGTGGPLTARANLDEMNFCSAHFKARADWFSALGKNEVTASMHRNYSERFLDQLAAATAEPIDCGMLNYMRSNDCKTDYLSAARDRTATDILTTFVQQGFGVAGLPTCMEDSVCTHCTDVLKGLPNDPTL